MDDIWAGACIGSMDLRRKELEPGRAKAWLRTDIDLLGDEKTCTTARALAMIDVANGIAPRLLPGDVAFPNLDLTAHLLRSPADSWLGLDTTASFGPVGIA